MAIQTSASRSYAIISLSALACLFLLGVVHGSSRVYTDQPEVHARSGATFQNVLEDAHHENVKVPDSWPESNGIQFEELQTLFLNHTKAENIREYTHFYASGNHLAGTNKSQPVWTRDLWESMGIKSRIEEYEAYVNYFEESALSLVVDGEITYKASLEEDVLPEDPITGLPNRTPIFFGYGASGNVTARYIYANYGSIKDFEELVDAGVEIKGTIALVRYNKLYRGGKIRNAQNFGCIGVIIYSDPGDDALKEEDGHKPWPQGLARNPSAVQRGSVSFLNMFNGDPTTPGYPSKHGVPRHMAEGIKPSVPAIPISYRDALPLLKALNGHGPNASSFNEAWHNGGLKYRGVEYNVGPSPETSLINLMVKNNNTFTPIWNAIGIINGTLNDEVVIIGNHHDSWTVGGAVDPVSGMAGLDELVRIFGRAVQKGWKPLRTIVFASWDMEEYALVGSTEWVEEYLPWLSDAAVAYLNTDVAVQGKNISFSSSAILETLLTETTKLIPAPGDNGVGKTVYDTWDQMRYTPGSGSDFAPFQYIAGIPIVNTIYAGEDIGMYNYHSNYDTILWFETVVDPDYEYTLSVTKIMSLLAVKMIESPLIPFSASDYTSKMANYLDNINDFVTDPTRSGRLALSSIPDQYIKALQPLKNAVKDLRRAAKELDFKAHLAASVIPHLPTSQKQKAFDEIRKINTLYKHLDRQFLYDKGLDGRQLFKHVVYAPDILSGYVGVAWPGIVEGIRADNLTTVETWVQICKEKVEKATEFLSDRPTTPSLMINTK